MALQTLMPRACGLHIQPCLTACPDTHSDVFHNVLYVVAHGRALLPGSLSDVWTSSQQPL